MINIETKQHLILCYIAFLIIILIVVGILCCEHKDKRIINKTIETERITEDKRIIEIETDKESDIDKAVEPVKDEPVFHLTDYERWVAECIVMGESGGEPYEGQIAVAQCILNACLKDDIKPSEVRKKYKYSGWKENPTKSAKRAVSAVFDEGYKITDEFILYFYAPKICNSEWHETQCHVITIGGHKFFKEWDR